MRILPVAQNLLEWVGLTFRLIPRPLAWSHFGYLASKCLLEAVDKGIFEIIGHKQLSVGQIALACNLDVAATHNLLKVLASMGLLREKNDLIHLMPDAKKWLLKDSPQSLYWLMIFDNRVCINWLNQTDHYLRTGKGIQYHQSLNEQEWFYYQKAMLSVANITANELAKKLVLPAKATSLLDIGGGHGKYSSALCNKYRTLHSTILELQEAVNIVSANEGSFETSDRIKHVIGDVTKYDLGRNVYDMVLMANVVHHLTPDQNNEVFKKVYQALKPGGQFVVVEVMNDTSIVYKGDMFFALGNFFFGLSSTSGTCNTAQIFNWLTASGFFIKETKNRFAIPGFTAVIANKK